MKIGIIFAMNEELNALKKYLKIENVNKIYELEFFEGIIGNINCVLVECGIGKVNAARATQVLIDNYKLDYVLNIGVAGGVSNDLNIGDIVVTSGENDNYKRDIPIGTISKIEEIPYNSSLYIEITPIIDFSRLENLVVINQKELKDKMETK